MSTPDAARATGNLCDSNSDCASGWCSYPLGQTSPGNSVCTIECSNDATCTTALGADFHCTVGLSPNRCRPTCTATARFDGYAAPPLGPTIDFDGRRGWRRRC